MLYDIGLKISYAYDQLANTGRHVLRLMPAEFAEQRVISGRLDVDPAAQERIERVDFFGNAEVEVAYRVPHEKVVFEVQCRVDRQARDPRPVSSPTLAAMDEAVASYRGLDPMSPHHFLGPSPRIVPSQVITAYAAALVKETTTAFEAMTALGAALHRDIKYDAEATTVDTSPEEAFVLRRGVCQDYSQIMIAGLRALGVPAGYVSGFLRTIPPAGKPRLAGADQMHAWVRGWCGPEAGWVDFDPTNNLVVLDDHIVVAHGRDYADVAPVKGVLRTAGSQASVQAVDVVPLG